MKSLIKLDLTDAELPVTAFFTETSITGCFIPLCDNIEKLYGEAGTHPFLIGIGGPPGSGKSVIALTISALLKDRNLSATILPLDGFHLKNEVLKERKITHGSRKVTLYEIKGAKETYDVQSFLLHLERLKTEDEFYWPIYSRKLHQPIKRGIKISDRRKIFIVEGNYLFLNTPPWNRAKEYFNLGIFIVPMVFIPFFIRITSKRILKKRIINRKLKGGIGKKDAREHYRMADRTNIKEVLKNSTGYNYLIIQKSKYRYVLS